MVIEYLTWALSSLLTCFAAVQVLLVVLALAKRNGKQEARPGRLHRFAVVISARNEQKVIGSLLDSLNGQNYPKELCDIVVVADNCTDFTAAIAQSAGAKVYARHDTDRVGKGYALGWLVNVAAPDILKKYDAIAVFDADNVAEENFLREMSAALHQNPVAMGYRDAKNPRESWVSACAALFFWTFSRFVCAPRAKLGMSVMVGGTGYAFRTSVIKDGWHTRTMLEDIEFSLQMIAKQEKIGFAPKCVFYDEQPVHLRMALRQRCRWSVGTYQNLGVTAPLLFEKGWRRDWRARLDAASFLFIVPIAALNMACLALSLCQALVYGADAWGLAIQALRPLALGWGVMLGQGLLTSLAERKQVLPRHLLAYPLYMALAGLVALPAMFMPNLAWHPIRRESKLQTVKEPSGL